MPRRPVRIHTVSDQRARLRDLLRETLRFKHRRLANVFEGFTTPSERGPIDFLLSRIEHGTDQAGSPSSRVGECFKRRHSNDRQAGRQRKTLGDTQADTQASKRARSDRNSEKLEIRQPELGGTQHRVDRRKETRGVIATVNRSRTLRERTVAVDHTDAGCPGCGVDTENPHNRRSTPAANDAADVVVERKGHEAK